MSLGLKERTLAFGTFRKVKRWRRWPWWMNPRKVFGESDAQFQKAAGRQRERWKKEPWQRCLYKLRLNAYYGESWEKEAETVVEKAAEYAYLALS